MEFSSLHCLHLPRSKKYSHFPRIARILFSDGVLRLFELFGSSSRIVWFSSPISCLGWEAFHQINQVRFFIQPIRSGLFTNLTSSAFGFPPQLSHWVRRFFTNSMLIDFLVFLLSSPTWLGGFLLIDYSYIVFIVPPELGAWYSGIWFFFLTFLFIGRRFFQPSYKLDTQH